MRRRAPVPAAALAISAVALVASCSTNVLVGVDPCTPETAGCRLVHRYTFDGVGTTVLDSVGGAHGNVVGGASLSGQGTLTLVGLTGPEAQYVALPHALLRQLHDATFEAWINWAGSAAHDGTRTPWQRIFDFGEGTNGLEGEQGSGADARSYLFVTPQSVPRIAGEVPSTRVAYQVPHDPQSSSLETVVNTTPLAIDVDTQVAVVIDSGAHLMSLFVNGVMAGAVTLLQDDPLSYVYDINDWLGRSQFSVDAGFSGTYLDFRIYAVALTAERIRANYDAGPDRVP